MKGLREGKARGGRVYLHGSISTAVMVARMQAASTFVVGVEHVLVRVSQRKLICDWRLPAAIWRPPIVRVRRH